VSKAWETLDERETPDGLLELRRREADDFLILVAGRVLMNSRASRSEEILGVKTCAGLDRGARVLIGGLGMAMTLRAVLDSIPSDARVSVAELHPIIVEWCRGPLAELTGAAVRDPRVETRICDVADCIRESASTGPHYDAIVLDLFEGPHARTNATTDPIYGRKAIGRAWNALAPGGVLGVWAEAPERGFEARLKTQGFSVETHRPGRGGLRHWVILGRRPGGSSPPSASYSA
jgi:spermidine synthase